MNYNMRPAGKMMIVLGIIFLPMTTLFAQSPSAIYSQVRLTVESREQLHRLIRDGFSLDHYHLEENSSGGYSVQCIVNDRELAVLRRSGQPFVVEIEDVTAFYQSRTPLTGSQKQAIRRSSGLQGFEFGSMAGFYTFAEVVTELDSMLLLYPHLISERQSIGTGHQGNDIWLVKISANPEIDEDEPDILYTSLHHAREPQGLMAVMFFMYYLLENYGSDPEVTYLLDNRELYFVPVVNPDGYLHNEFISPGGGGLWRKNRRDLGNGIYGVDLNRNYGFEWGFDDVGSSPDPVSENYRGDQPFSEPESQAIRDLTIARNFTLAMNYHTFGDALIYPWGYLPSFLTPDSLPFMDLAAQMTAVNEYTFGTVDQTLGYVANGDSDDWMYGDTSAKDRILAFTPEIGGFQDGFWPEQQRIFPLAEENLSANLGAAWGGGGMISVAGSHGIRDIGNGNGYADPGEMVRMTFGVINIGLDSLSAVHFRLKSNDPFVFVSEGESSSPLQIAARESAETDTFTLAINRQAPPGLQPELLLEADYGGYIKTFSVRDLLIGTPDTLFHDDAEQGLSAWTRNESWDTTPLHYASPDSAFTDSPSGYYLPHANNFLLLEEPINLADASAAYLEFRTRWDIQKNFDGGFVEVSTDGNSWVSLEGQRSSSGSGKGIQTFGKAVYDGAQTAWVRELVDLSFVLGSPSVMLRFRLQSDGILERDGWYIDDISIIRFNDVVVGVAENAGIPSALYLSPNYPNPFNPATTIRFGIPRQQNIQLVIINSLGQIVNVLLDDVLPPGNHRLEWNATDQAGQPVSSGIYFYSLITGDEKIVRKMLLLR